jgi:hypothetical protein
LVALPFPQGDNVPRGPSHEPVPYHYDPAAWRDITKAFVEDGPACVLYSGTSFMVESDGTVEQIVHEVTHLNNRRGVECFGEFRGIAFDPSYQKLTLYVARVHKASGHTLDIGPPHTHMRDVNTDYQVYRRHQQLLISFPDLTAGDVIEVKWGLHGKDPEGHEQFYGSHRLGSDYYPTVHAELRIRLPHGRALYSRVSGGQLDLAVHEGDDGRLSHWQVRVSPPLPAEKDLPSKEEQRLKIHYSTFATWDEVDDWCQKVRKGCWECTPDMARVIQDMTRGLTTEADKARALTYWVRENVRYLSLHERESWAPHAPRRVFATRYGDCKDQCQLLAVLLRGAGVKAGVGIISWAESGDILESFPSPWGNHTIVLATVEGRDAWIDPVMRRAAWDVLAEQDHDRLCYVSDEKASLRLVRTPKLKPQDDCTEQTTKVHVSHDGSACCEREIVYRGLAASEERDRLLSLSEAGRRQHLLARLQDFQAQARITNMTIDALGLGDLDLPVRVRVEFEVPKDFAQRSCHVSDVEVWHNVLRYRAAPDRMVPLQLGRPCELIHRFVVDLAPGHHFANEAESREARSAWGTFQRTVRTDANGRCVDIQSHLVMEQCRVEPADLPALAKFQGEVRQVYGTWLQRIQTRDLADAPFLEAELAKSPEDSDLALLLATLYRANGKPSEATRVLRSALDTAADERLAGALLEVTDAQEALAKANGAKSSPSTPVVASQDKDGRIVLRIQIPENSEQPVVSADPGPSEKKAEAAYGWHQQTYRLDVKEVKVYDDAGKEIDAKALSDLLRNETPALYVNGEELDPLHLRTVKRGMLVFVYSPPNPGKAPMGEGKLPAIGLTEFLSKQGYTTTHLEKLGFKDQFGVRVRVRGKVMLLALDAWASNTILDRCRVRNHALKWDDDVVYELDSMEIAGIESGPLKAHHFDMTSMNQRLRASNYPLLDGVLGADVLLPLEAVIDHGGARLYLRKQESKE